MRNVFIAVCIGMVMLAVGGIYLLTRDVPAPASSDPSANVTINGGVQIIDIRAKGGYSPRVTKAKADTPTTLRVETNGTFDCSLALTVPAVGFRDTLPTTGVTPIEIPPQPAGTSLKGVCSMGMYAFTVKFE